jgi:hypothetical protein
MNVFCWRFLRNGWRHRVDRAVIPEESSERWAIIHSDHATDPTQKELTSKIISESLNEQYWG